MIQDLRYAFRILKRNRLAIVAVLTLGLGIGGVTVMFSVVDAVVLRPLPFPDAGRLVRIWEVTREGDRFSFSDPTYLDLQAEAHRLESVAAFREGGTGSVLTGGRQPERVLALPVSASFFTVVRVRPAIGQPFTAEDDRPDAAEHGVVLSDALWRRQFGGEPAV